MYVYVMSSQYETHTNTCMLQSYYNIRDNSFFNARGWAGKNEGWAKSNSGQSEGGGGGGYLNNFYYCFILKQILSVRSGLTLHGLQAF